MTFTQDKSRNAKVKKTGTKGGLGGGELGKGQNGGKINGNMPQNEFWWCEAANGNACWFIQNPGHILDGPMGGSNHPICGPPSREATDWPKRYEFRSQPLTGHGYDKPTYLASSDTHYYWVEKHNYLLVYTPCLFLRNFLFFGGL